MRGAATDMRRVGGEQCALAAEHCLRAPWRLRLTHRGSVQVGFAMLEVGSVRVFYVQNILIKVWLSQPIATWGTLIAHALNAALRPCGARPTTCLQYPPSQL